MEAVLLAILLIATVGAYATVFSICRCCEVDSGDENAPLAFPAGP